MLSLCPLVLAASPLAGDCGDHAPMEPAGRGPGHSPAGDHWQWDLVTPGTALVDFQCGYASYVSLDLYC